MIPDAEEEGAKYYPKEPTELQRKTRAHITKYRPEPEVGEPGYVPAVPEVETETAAVYRGEEAEKRSAELEYERATQFLETVAEKHVREKPGQPIIYTHGDYSVFVSPAGTYEIIRTQNLRFLQERLSHMTYEQAYRLGYIPKEEYFRYKRSEAMQRQTAARLWAMKTTRYRQLWETEGPESALSYALAAGLMSPEQYGAEIQKIARQREQYEVNLAVLQLTEAVQGPKAAMEFALSLGWVSRPEYEAWSRQAAYKQAAAQRLSILEWMDVKKTYEKLWQEDPNKALEYLYRKKVITAEEYKREYLHPTFTEAVYTKIREGLAPIPKEWYEYSPFWMPEVVMGGVQAIDVLVRGVGAVTGQPWAKKLKPLPEHLRREPVGVLISPLFGPGAEETTLAAAISEEGIAGIQIGPYTVLRGLRLPRLDERARREFELYAKKMEESPSWFIGDVLWVYGESLAAGWALRKGGQAMRRLGGAVARTRICARVKTELLKTFQPARIPVREKIVGAVREISPEFIQKRVWPVYYGKKKILEQIPLRGEEYWGYTPDITFLSTIDAEYFKYVGYPVLHGEKIGVKIIKTGAPTAFQQIQKAIEMGKYRAMGGLPATQQVVFAKPSMAAFKTAAAQWAAWTAPGVVAKTVPSWIAPVVGEALVAGARGALVPVVQPRFMPEALEKFRPQLLLPEFAEEREDLLPVPVGLDVELTKERFRPVELLRPTPKKREDLIPVVIPDITQVSEQDVAQWQRQWVQQIQKQRLVFDVPQVVFAPPIAPPYPSPPPYPPPPPPIIPPLKWPQRVGGGMFLPPKGAWLYRKHPIAGPAAVAKGLTFAKKSFEEMVSFPKKRVRKRRRRKR